MRYPRARLPRGGLSISAVLLLALASWPKTGVTSGYYNLGAFWRTPQVTTPCTNVNGNVSTISKVQNWKKTGPTSATSVTVSLTNPEALGNTLIVAAAARANETMTVSDSLGNTWSSLSAQVNTADSPKNTNIQLWYAPNIKAGSNTLTLTVSSADYLWLAVSEYAGLDPVSPLANSNGKTAPSSTNALTTGNVTASAYSSLILGFFADASGNGATNMSVGGGFTSEAATKNANYLLLVEDEFPEAAAGYNPGATSSNTDAYWAGVAASFSAQCVLFTSMTPVVASLSPNGSAVAGGEAVTITGSQFDGSATVTIGGTNCPVTGHTGSTSITCTAPAGSAGAADVAVTDSISGHTGTLASGYLYGTVGTQSWLGGISSGFSWQTFNAAAPLNFYYYMSYLDSAIFAPTKMVYGVVAGTGSLFTVNTAGSQSVARVTRYNATTGAEIGWIGTTEGVPSGDPFGLGCTTTIPYLATPGWCTGGTSGAYDGPTTSLDGMITTPNGIALDPTSTTLYVTDTYYGSSRLNKFSATTGAFQGWLGTWATNTGGSAGCPPSGGGVPTGWCIGGTTANLTRGAQEGAFGNPSDVAVGASGADYLYVLDGYSGRVEQFTASTGAYIGWMGVVGTTAPTGCASTNPSCALGSPGAFSGGFVTGGNSAISNLSGGFVDATNYLYADSSYLYVSDANNFRVQRFNLPQGTYAGWLGQIGTSNGTDCTAVGSYSGRWCSAGGAAQNVNVNPSATGLDNPNQITSDGTYLYVADDYQDIVIRFNLDASNPVWIGATTSGFSGVWHSTATENSVGTYGSNSPFGGGMSGTAGVAVNSATNELYTSDFSNNRLNSYALSSGAFNGYLANQPTAPTGWNSTGAPVAGMSDGEFSNAYASQGLPQNGVALDATNGMVYVTDPGSNRISKFNSSTGAFQGWVGKVFLTPSSGVAGCSTTTGGSSTPGWCFGGSGFGSKDGVSNSDGAYNFPTGLAVDPSGTYLYVAESGVRNSSNYSRVSRIQTSNGSPQGFIGYISATGTGCGGTLGPTNGWCIGSGAQSGPKTTNPIPDTAFSNAAGIAIDPAGTYLYVGDSGDARVLKFNTAGVVQGWIGWGKNTGGSAGCPPSAGGVTTGWCLGGTTSALGASTANGGFNTPTYVTVDSSGSLWVTDAFQTPPRIQQFNAATGAFIKTFNSTSGNTPLAMGEDPTGKTLITYEVISGQSVPSSGFVRYATATSQVLGVLGYLWEAAAANGQQGCTGLGAAGVPSLWCSISSPGTWAGPTPWATYPASQIVIDSANQSMYFFDTGTSRLVRMSINN